MWTQCLEKMLCGEEFPEEIVGGGNFSHAKLVLDIRHQGVDDEFYMSMFLPLLSNVDINGSCLLCPLKLGLIDIQLNRKLFLVCQQREVNEYCLSQYKSIFF